jgi:hypothetical protein
MSNLKNIVSQLLTIAEKINETKEEETTEIQNYRKLLTKLKGKGVIGKLNVLLDSSRMNKNDLYWSRALDNTDSSEGDFNDIMKKVKIAIMMNYAVVPFLKKLLEFGINNGYVALARILNKNRVKMTITKINEE